MEKLQAEGPKMTGLGKESMVAAGANLEVEGAVDFVLFSSENARQVLGHPGGTGFLSCF